MWCAPCAAKAAARRKAMEQQIRMQNGDKAAENFVKVTSGPASVGFNTNKRVLPRYEGRPNPITNTEVRPTTVWDEAAHAFRVNKN